MIALRLGLGFVLCFGVASSLAGQGSRLRSASASSSDISEGTSAIRIRMDVQVALIPVHVTDPAGASVMGLNRANFQLFEDGVEQRINYFTNEDAPLSLGFLLDCSESMKKRMESSLRAAVQFLKSSHPDDEFFLVKFSDHPKMIRH